MKVIVIGIMPQEKIRKRVLPIARGDYKPKPDEPKVWFTSMKSLAEVLSDDNRALLKVSSEAKPESISELAEATGRKPGKLYQPLPHAEQETLAPRVAPSHGARCPHCARGRPCPTLSGSQARPAAGRGARSRPAMPTM